MLLSGYVADANASSSLPAGLVSESKVPAHFLAWLHVFRCEAFIIDNETVVPDEVFTVLTMSVIPDDELRRNAAYHEYVLDAWVASDDLSETYARSGFPLRALHELVQEDSAAGTDVSLRDGTRTNWTVSAPYEDEEFPTSAVTGYRWYFDDLSWMDVDLVDLELDLIQAAATLEYHGAPFAKYTGTEAGMEAAWSYQSGHGDLETSFGGK